MENKSGRIFCVRQVYKFLPINLGACKPFFYLFIYFFYTPHLRRKSTMRRFFYHTDLVQNAVLHNFSRQIAFIQYSGLSKHAWTFNQRNRSKNFQNHLSGQPVLTFDKCQICEEILKDLELRFNVIKNLLSLFFLNGFITMCNLKKRLVRSAF